MAELKPESVDAEKNDEEQTASQADKPDKEQTERQTKKNDEVAALQAELEKTVETHRAADAAMDTILESLEYATKTALEEAAPDEWAALVAAWNALDKAVDDATEEQAPLAFHFLSLGYGEDLYEKFAPVESETRRRMELSSFPSLTFEISVPLSAGLLKLADQLKRIAPDEWAAYEAAHATLKKKAPAECAAYEAALGQWEAWWCGRDRLANKLEQRASEVRSAYDALLDAEWHAKWAEQLAPLAVASGFYTEEDGYDISIAVAALAAMFQAFESARMINAAYLGEEPDLPYWKVKKAYSAVHKAFCNILSSMGDEWSKWYDELIELKSEADKKRKERKASS